MKKIRGFEKLLKRCVFDKGIVFVDAENVAKVSAVLYNWRYSSVVEQSAAVR